MASRNPKQFDLSIGNKKMNKGFLIWNLPALTSCPGKTKICACHCYARKAETMYPSVIPSRVRNYEFIRNNANWYQILGDFIDKKITHSKTFAGFFRIHESGDFFSQDYLNGWKIIAARFPSVHFLAFTKSFDLDYSDIPPNFQIVFSIMEDTDLMQHIPEGPKAYAGNCDYDHDKTFECPGLCDACGVCWDLRRFHLDVHFEMH